MAERVEFQRRVVLGEFAQEVSVRGDDAGNPLLLVLHGGPGAPSYYLKTLSALGTDRKIIFYDQ